MHTDWCMAARAGAIAIALLWSFTLCVDAQNIIPSSVFTDACDPASNAAFVSYCDGKTPESSTARATVLEISRATRGELEFTSGSADELGLRMSLSVDVDEANHLGCNMTFTWSVVPQAGQDRICSPTVCATDKDPNLGAGACDRVVPITVRIQIPGVAHEMPLATTQYSPYEYVLLNQPEYFPQRMKHFPVPGNPFAFVDNNQIADLMQANNGYTPRGDVINVWQLIDPNYETDTDDAFYCARGEPDDTSGRRQCCFRGRLFTADDEDDAGRVSADNNLQFGRNLPSLPNSPALLDFCAANKDSAYGAPAFAWSKADKSAQPIDTIFGCYSLQPNCDSQNSYYPAIPPLQAIENYIQRGATKLLARDTRFTEAEDPLSELIDVEVAGTMATQHEYRDHIHNDDSDRIAYQQALKNLYAANAVYLNTDQGPPAANIDDADNLEAFRGLLARDLKNLDASKEEYTIVNGTWITIPMKRFDPAYMRRLRCGYCGMQPELETYACPTVSKSKPGGRDDTNFKSCAFGDVSQKCKDVKKPQGDPENYDDRCNSADNIYWSEIRHVRAYAQSMWFLGTNPVCAAMKLDSRAPPITHQRINVQITKGNTVPVPLEFTVSNTDATSQLGGSGNVRVDLAPGESDAVALQNPSDGVYISDGDRIVVCDSVLYPNGFLTVDHFANSAPSNPFENPFDALQNPDVEDETIGTCAGCSTVMQFHDPEGVASEQLLWYYMDKQEAAADWRSESDINMDNIQNNAQGVEAAKSAVRDTCGKCGVGMELFQPDGCDAIANNQMTEPDAGESFILPNTLTDSCLNLKNGDTDDRTCRSQMHAVMPDALGCSKRLPRLCAPTDNAPAGKYRKIREDTATAARSINSKTGPRSFNDLSAYNSGFPPNTNLDAPNTWLGVSRTAETKRALYTNNKRRPDRAARRPAWRESTLSINLSGTYAELSPVLLPCVYDIDYVPCQIASNQAGTGATAAGSFRTALQTNAPASIPERRYTYVVAMGPDATCALRLASTPTATMVAQLVVAVTDTSIVTSLDFECTLKDSNVPVASNRTGYIAVFENGAQLLTVPIMSCDKQSEYVAQFGGIDPAYTPLYDSNEDPCTGNAGATKLRGSGVPLVLYGDERPERSALDPPVQLPSAVSPSPSAFPTATSVAPNDPFSTPTAATPSTTADPDLGPQRSANPTASPSPSASPVASITEIETEFSDVEDENNMLYALIAIVAGGILLCCVCICCVCIIYKRSSTSATNYDYLDTSLYE